MKVRTTKIVEYRDVLCIAQSWTFCDLRTQKEYKNNGFISRNSKGCCASSALFLWVILREYNKRKLKEWLLNTNMQFNNEHYPMAKHYKEMLY